MCNPITTTAVFTMVQNVRKNYKEFAKENVRRATLARKSQSRVGNLSDSKFKLMVSKNSVKKCPVQHKHMTNASLIFSLDLQGMGGKTARRPSKRVETGHMSIPDNFHQLHHFVTLTADIMFVNGVPFLTTLSRNIRIFTSEHVPTCTGKQLASSI